jgi:hypothetical protein
MSNSTLSPSDFLTAVDCKLRRDYYINVGDLSFTEADAEKCLELNETPDSVVEHYAEKYNLEKL